MNLEVIVAYVVAALLIVTGLVYKKYTSYKSNVPSVGLFFLSRRQKKTCDDVKNFAEEHNAKLVHGFYNWQSCMLITHPDTAQIMLKDEETFEKYSDSQGPLSILMRESLVNTNGEQYKEMKEIISPAFHFEYIKKIVPFFVSKTQELFSEWDKNPQDIQVGQATSQFTIDALGLGAFGIDFKTISGANDNNYLKSYKNLVSLIPVPEKVQKESVVKLNQMTAEIIDFKKSSKKSVDMDMLDRFLESGKLSKKVLTDNVFLLFIAGHETTSHALEWGIHFLAKYPEIQQIARDEVDKHLKGETPDGDSVKALSYLEMFIKEVMRSKPPVATLISRNTTKDAQVGEYFIPKNTKIGLSMYTIHHLKEFWGPDPYKFDPLRFSPENAHGRHPFAYLPFSLGRRNCIGNNFSLLEQKIFLSMLLQRYVITPSDKSISAEFPTFHVCWPFNIRVNVTARSVDGANK